MGFILGGGVLSTSIADMILNIVNRYTAMSLAAPALVQLELNVIHWLCDLIGYDPHTAFGNFSSGASAASWHALLVVRRCYFPGNRNLDQAVGFVCENTHHAAAKAWVLCGFQKENLITVKCQRNTPAMKMDLQDLQTRIARVASSNNAKIPVLIIGTAGSTDTGATDDLVALRVIANDYNCWLHVDAAYGGMFALTARGRRVLHGIELADSVSLDAHKSLFMPSGTGMLLVKQKQRLRDAFSLVEEGNFMPECSAMNWAEFSPELTKSAVGVRLWITLQCSGVARFREMLETKLDLSEYLLRKLERIPNVEIMSELSLTILTFRYHPQNISCEETLGRVNRRLLANINEKGRVFLSGTVIRECQFVIRVCVLSFRTKECHISQLLEDVRESILQSKTL